MYNPSIYEPEYVKAGRCVECGTQLYLDDLNRLVCHEKTPEGHICELEDPDAEQ